MLDGLSEVLSFSSCNSNSNVFQFAFQYNPLLWMFFNSYVCNRIANRSIMRVELLTNTLVVMCKQTNKEAT
jgi:hypothetical protein